MYLLYYVILAFNYVILCKWKLPEGSSLNLREAPPVVSCGLTGALLDSYSLEERF